MGVTTYNVYLVCAIYIQGDSGVKVNIFGLGPCPKKKKVDMSMCPSLNGNRDKNCLNIHT